MGAIITEGVILALIAAVSGGGVKWIETRSTKQIAEINQKANKEIEALKRDIEFYKAVVAERDRDNQELEELLEKLEAKLEEAKEAEERYRREYWLAVEELSRFKVIVLKSLEKSGLSIEELEEIVARFNRGD